MCFSCHEARVHVELFAWKGITKVIHAIADNYATHKHPNVMKWLTDHLRWTFHFTPTSASWLNAVEGFFSTITRRKICHGVFKSVADLQDAIKRYVKAHNQNVKAFARIVSKMKFQRAIRIDADILKTERQGARRAACSLPR